MEETVKDTDEELVQQIVDELAVQPNYESEEELEVVPQITVNKALQGLKVLQGITEQQEQGYQDALRQLNALEYRLLQQRRRGGSQVAITAYFS